MDQPLLLHNISLQPYNTFHIDARAQYFGRFTTLKSMEAQLEAYHELKNAPLLVLGGGSNILLTGSFEGLVLKNELKGISLIGEDEQHYYVKAMAGENWHELVQYCIEAGYAGMENLSLIPGCVGASPMQNIGAYGVEIKDIFHSLQAWHIADRTMVDFTLQDCEFGYRESVFKRKYRNQFIITSVTYRLNKEPRLNTSYGAIEQELERMGIQEPGIRDISRAVIRIRQSKLPDPAVIGNAGSFFKNPVISKTQYQQLQSQYPHIPGYSNGDQVKLAAGWLIEQCGWKGYRDGDAGCHAQQALVLVNHGQASGTQILQLAQRIIESVHQQFHVELETEVNILP
jgi:UDP-N-acetylmuramate dehydrogenase